MQTRCGRPLGKAKKAAESDLENEVILVASKYMYDLHAGGSARDCALGSVYSWNSTGKIGRIGRHRAETHRYFNIRFFGPMPPDASDFPGGIPVYPDEVHLVA